MSKDRLALEERSIREEARYWFPKRLVWQKLPPRGVGSSLAALQALFLRHSFAFVDYEAEEAGIVTLECRSWKKPSSLKAWES